MKKLFLGVMVAAMGVSTTAKAEDGVEFEVGADVVSSYVWRGTDCGGFSIQPGATVSYKGLSLGAWASAELFEGSDFANMNEFDLCLGYEIGNFSILFTDYYFCNARYIADWNWSRNSAHQFEGSLGYDFGKVALSWNTMIAGDDSKADGDRAYSSYFSVSAPFKLGGVECSGEIGVSPFESELYGNSGFAVTNCAFTASKELKGIPFMGQIVYNPCADATYFVVGLSF